MKKKSILLLLSFIMVGCGGSNVNKTKSPFSDDNYKPIGMTGKYKVTSAMNTVKYGKLKDFITTDKYFDNSEYSVVSQYTRTEETRDLKAAYFGTNLGATNCSLKHQVTTNTRYNNGITTKFSTSHKEDQNASGGINKSNPIVNDYYKDKEDNTYEMTEQTSDGGINPKTRRVTGSTTENTFPLNVYKTDIKNNLVDIKSSAGKKTIPLFNLLGDSAVYGMSDNKYLIKEAASLFDPYSTIVGDTYKAVNNYFYEALLEEIPNHEGEYRFTDFRFYSELLILSEPVTDEEKVPVLFLDKPQLVEYSEIIYSINYKNSLADCGQFTDPIPEPDPSI